MFDFNEELKKMRAHLWASSPSKDVAELTMTTMLEGDADHGSTNYAEWVAAPNEHLIQAIKEKALEMFMDMGLDQKSQRVIALYIPNYLTYVADLVAEHDIKSGKRLLGIARGVEERVETALESEGEESLTVFAEAFAEAAAVLYKTPYWGAFRYWLNKKLLNEDKKISRKWRGAVALFNELSDFVESKSKKIESGELREVIEEFDKELFDTYLSAGVRELLKTMADTPLSKLLQGERDKLHPRRETVKDVAGLLADAAMEGMTGRRRPARRESASVLTSQHQVVANGPGSVAIGGDFKGVISTGRNNVVSDDGKRTVRVGSGGNDVIVTGDNRVVGKGNVAVDITGDGTVSYSGGKYNVHIGSGKPNICKETDEVSKLMQGLGHEEHTVIADTLQGIAIGSNARTINLGKGNVIGNGTVVSQTLRNGRVTRRSVSAGVYTMEQDAEGRFVLQKHGEVILEIDADGNMQRKPTDAIISGAGRNLSIVLPDGTVLSIRNGTVTMVSGSNVITL